MMSFDKVVVGLQVMHISLRRFEIHLNNYSTCTSLDILYNVEEAFLLQDTKKLEELSEIARISQMPQINLSIKILLKKETTDDLETLTNFLYAVTTWGYKELAVFYIMMNKISPKEILDILYIIKNNSKGIYHSSEYHRILTLVLCNASEILAICGYQVESKNLLDTIEKYKLASTMFLRTIYLASKGIWLLHFDNIAQGKKMLKDSLHIHELASFPAIASFYKKKYIKYISDDD